MRCISAILAGCLSLSVIVGSVRAEDDFPPGYKEAVRAGLNELDAGNYPEARAEFRRAHKILPNARTRRSLGMVEFELRNYAESARLLEEALRSEERPLEGKIRNDTEELLGRARRYLGEVRVTLTPKTAELLVDGTAMRLPADGILRLQVGSHTLEARASGKIADRRVLEIAGEDRTEVRLTPSDPNLNVGKNEPPPDKRPSDESPAYKKWWVWTTVAVVLAGGAAATVLLMPREKKERPEAQQGTNSINDVSLQTLRSF